MASSGQPGGAGLERGSTEHPAVPDGKTFDPAELDPLCRYVLFDAEGNTVLATNMDSSHLQKAMREWAGNLRWEIGYEQYYLRARLQDGTVCLLQFDYAVPYADPTLRDILPDVQTMHLILGIFLLVGVVAWSTHRSGAFLRRETARLTEASRQVAEKGHREHRLYRGKGAGVR